MVDSKSTGNDHKGFWKSILKDLDWLENFFEDHHSIKSIAFAVLVAGIILFLYCIWFKWTCEYPIHEEKIVFTIQLAPTIIEPNLPLNLPPFICNPLMSDPVIAKSYLKHNKLQMETLNKLIDKVGKQNQQVNKKILDCEYLTVSNLNAFYAALFTLLAVIVGIAGLLGWQTIKEYKKSEEDLKSKFEGVKSILKSLEEKIRLSEWAKGKFQRLKGNSLTSLDLSSDEDISQSKKIKDFVINEFRINSDLEIFYAYNLAYGNKGERKRDDLEKAKIILDSIINSGLLKNERIKDVSHILGQINFDLYRLQSEKFNFFKNKKIIKKFSNEDIEKAIITLLDSAFNYKKSLEVPKTDGIDETRGNLAMDLIELHKYSIAYNEDEDRADIVNYLRDKTKELAEEESPLQSAKKYLGEIRGQKSFYQLWDETRRIFYENKWEERINKTEWSEKDETDWNNNIRNVLTDAIKFRYELSPYEKGFFFAQIEKELNEFTEISKTGFPGKTEFVAKVKKLLSSRG